MLCIEDQPLWGCRGVAEGLQRGCRGVAEGLQRGCRGVAEGLQGGTFKRVITPALLGLMPGTPSLLCSVYKTGWPLAGVAPNF
jgi:hypothetical protein